MILLVMALKLVRGIEKKIMKVTQVCFQFWKKARIKCVSLTDDIFSERLNLRLKKQVKIQNLCSNFLASFSLVLNISPS